MQFHVRLIDGPETKEKRFSGREAHWQYLDDHADHIMGRGPTYKADMSDFSSTLFFLDFGSWDDVRTFLANEPHNMNGVYSEIKINRWENISGRFQRDFPRFEGQVNWCLRGFSKPNMHDNWLNLRSEYLDYIKSYETENIVVHGPIFNDDGTNWTGSASLISMPKRESIDKFLLGDPLHKNELYDNISIEQFKFGGRPGQIT